MKTLIMMMPGVSATVFLAALLAEIDAFRRWYRDEARRRIAGEAFTGCLAMAVAALMMLVAAVCMEQATGPYASQAQYLHSGAYIWALVLVVAGSAMVVAAAITALNAAYTLGGGERRGRRNGGRR